MSLTYAAATIDRTFGTMSTTYATATMSARGISGAARARGMFTSRQAGGNS